MGTEALKRLRDYLWGSHCVAKYKETRNGLVGKNYSTKFSPWLALGSLSPRMIFIMIKKYEKEDMDKFKAWADGRTGVPFVDANMRELKETGWMSNRGRQNVASFLVKDLGLDWRLGAEWFESQLLDHDVCSNYGNWNYAAGIGNDPRTDRKFNMVKQGLDYDAQGDFIRTWIPELSKIKTGKVHTPWKLSPAELNASGISLGETYPNPVVAPEWARHDH